MRSQTCWAVLDKDVPRLEAQILAPLGRSDLAYEWFNKLNNHPIFGGLSIKEYLLQRKNIEGFYTVRR